jgi:heat shock protein HtpX
MSANNRLDYNNIGSADWRRQLAINDRRTRIVIALFIIIYLFIGLIVDLYAKTSLAILPLSTALLQLVTFQIFPTATLITVGVAIFSIFITFAFHDKIVMLGTNYYELTSDNARSNEERQLYNVVTELQVAANLAYIPKIFIIEADYINAFASGYSQKSALIAITRGLLAKLTRSELQAVIAHELSHIRHHDIKLTLVATVLCNIMLIIIDMLFYNMIYGGGRSKRSSDSNNGNQLFIFVMLLRFVLPLLTVILLLYLSRTREYMADAGAVELIRDNTPLANALIKISSDHESNVDLYAKEYKSTPHENIRVAAYIYDPTQAGISIAQSIGGLFSTHPPLAARLKALGFVKEAKN